MTAAGKSFSPLLASLTAVICAVLASAAGGQVPDGQVRSPSRTMALTFDDLPFVAAGQPYFPDATTTTEQLLQVLRRHRAPAIGFVNERQLEAAGDARRRREALLQAWIDAGMTLGNHTYSHPDFNTVTIDAFKEEIVKGEPTVDRLMAGRAPGGRFFRHPMTHTGDTKAKKDAIDAFLAARGYRIAPHTIENSDFIFNAVYAAARAAGDLDLAQRVQDAYVDLTMEATTFAEGASRELFTREIPQTLLLHANVLTAGSLEKLLSRFEARGYRFVTLDEAMKDPAYATPDTAIFTSGPTWYWRWSRTLGVRLSPQGDPEVPDWIMDAYRRRVSSY